jgi:hypothetical protein
VTDINDTLKAAERLAARILCQWPTIDLDNVDWVQLGRDIGFKWDIYRTGGRYGIENVKQEASFLRYLAGIASKSWTAAELHQEALRLYDPEKNVEEQSDDFYLAQAQFQLVRSVYGHQPQPSSAVA